MEKLSDWLPAYHRDMTEATQAIKSLQKEVEISAKNSADSHKSE